MEKKKLAPRKIYDDDNVRFDIKRLILLCNDFIKEYNRMPTPDDKKAHKLVQKLSKYKKDKKFNKEEIEYIKKELLCSPEILELGISFNDNHGLKM